MAHDTGKKKSPEQNIHKNTEKKISGKLDCRSSFIITNALDLCYPFFSYEKACFFRLYFDQKHIKNT